MLSRWAIDMVSTLSVVILLCLVLLGIGLISRQIIGSILEAKERGLWERLDPLYQAWNNGYDACIDDFPKVNWTEPQGGKQASNPYVIPENRDPMRRWMKPRMKP